MRTEVRRFTSLFQRWGEKFPCGLLAVWLSNEQKCELASQAHKQTEMCIYMEVLLLLFFCCLGLWMCTMSWQSTFHLISFSLPPQSSFFHSSSMPLSLAGSFSCPLHFTLTFSPPHPSLPPVFYLTSPLLVVLVCALVCHEEGGGWLVVGGLDRHLILALPHNVGMCNLFKIRFPRWVLSIAMVSTIMRVCTVGLLSLPHSLCLSYGWLWHFCTWIYRSFHSCLGEGAAIVPKACKPLQPFMLVNRWQSTVKPQWSEHILSKKTDS